MTILYIAMILILLGLFALYTERVDKKRMAELRRKQVDKYEAIQRYLDHQEKER